MFWRNILGNDSVWDRFWGQFEDFRAVPAEAGRSL